MKSRGETSRTGYISPPDKTLLGVVLWRIFGNVVRYEIMPSYRVYQPLRRKWYYYCSSRDAVCSDKTLLGEKMSAGAAARESKAPTEGEGEGYRVWVVTSWIL